MKQSRFLVILPALLLAQSISAFASSPCDIIQGATDSENRFCHDDQFAVINYTVGHDGLYWENYQEQCYDKRDDAERAMRHAQDIGVCSKPGSKDRDDYPCDVLWGSTDSNGRFCNDNQASVMVYMPQVGGGTFWDTYQESCYDSEGDARAALKHARDIGVCKRADNQKYGSAIIPDVNQQLASILNPNLHEQSSSVANSSSKPGAFQTAQIQVPVSPLSEGRAE
jgi:hypothetical protein